MEVERNYLLNEDVMKKEKKKGELKEVTQMEEIKEMRNGVSNVHVLKNGNMKLTGLKKSKKLNGFKEDVTKEDVTKEDITKEDLTKEELTKKCLNMLNKYKIGWKKEKEQKRFEKNGSLVLEKEKKEEEEEEEEEEGRNKLTKDIDTINSDTSRPEKVKDDSIEIKIKKKKKRKTKTKGVVSTESKLLTATGTCGLIVYDGIMELYTKGIQPFLITSLKRSYCIYDPHKIRTGYRSNYFEEDIKNLHYFNHYVYVLFNKKIYKIDEIGRKKVFKHCGNRNFINFFTVPNFLISYTKKEIIIWSDIYEGPFILPKKRNKLPNEKKMTEEKKKKQNDGECIKNGDISNSFDFDVNVNSKNGWNFDSNSDSGLDSDVNPHSECDEEEYINKKDYDGNKEDKEDKGENDNLEEEKGKKKEENEEEEEEEEECFVKRVQMFDEQEDREIKFVHHPNGYVNKVIIITNDNKFYLYNLNKEKVIHEFECLKTVLLSVNNSIKILSKGINDNEICLITNKNELFFVNIETDKITYRKNIHMENDTVTCVDFYKYEYGGEIHTAILVGTERGKVVMLHMRENQYFVKIDIHDTVKKVIVSPHGYIYTCGMDNKIHLIRFNIESFSLEIVKTRSSCYGSINNIKYADDEQYKLIVSTYRINANKKKEGTLCLICPSGPEQNVEFSWSKRWKLENTAIIDFDINVNREYDWNNILICIENSHQVFLASSFKKTIAPDCLTLDVEDMHIPKDEQMSAVYQMDKRRKGVHVDSTYDGDFIIIKHSNNQKKNEPEYKIIEDFTNEGENEECRNKYAKSVLISKCGHIGIVGYNSGEIHSFNIQSLKYRKEYKLNKYSLKSKAHIGGDVLKMHLYDVNYFISASNSEVDRNVNVWNIYTGELVYTYDIIKNDYKTKAEHNVEHTGKKENGKNVHITSIYHQNILTTVCMSDNRVFIIDIAQKFVSRKFHFTCEVRNVIFSKDNRLVFFAFKNNSLLIYEIISNTFIDYVIFKNPIVAMIYNDIHLYTSHEKTANFLNTWTNKNLYSVDNYNSFISDYNVCKPIEIEKCSDEEREEEEKEEEEEEEEEGEKEAAGENKNKHKKSQALPNIHSLIKTENDGIYDNKDLIFLGESTKGKQMGQEMKKEEEKDTNGKTEVENLNQLMKPYKSSERQIDERLLTMSGFNISKIAHLVFLDQIKEKCKVEENIKKNEQIPFFLSLKLDGNVEYVDEGEKKLLKNITGINEEEEQQQKGNDEVLHTEQNENEVGNDQKEQWDEKEEKTKEGEEDKEKNKKENKEDTKINIKGRRIIDDSDMDMHFSKLQNMLKKNDVSYIKVLNYLKGLSSSGVHYNLLCLNTERELETMMNFFIYHVKSNDNIDLIQAYLLIFLRAHGKKLLKSKKKNLRHTKNALLQEIRKSWSNINVLFENIIFLIKFLSNMQQE